MDWEVFNESQTIPIGTFVFWFIYALNLETSGAALRGSSGRSIRVSDKPSCFLPGIIFVAGFLMDSGVSFHSHQDASFQTYPTYPFKGKRDYSILFRTFQTRTWNFRWHQAVLGAVVQVGFTGFTHVAKHRSEHQACVSWPLIWWTLLSRQGRLQDTIPTLKPGGASDVRTTKDVNRWSVNKLYKMLDICACFWLWITSYYLLQYWFDAGWNIQHFQCFQ